MYRSYGQNHTGLRLHVYEKVFFSLELYPAYRRNWENATTMTIIVLFVAVVKLEKHVTANDAAREHV